MADVLKFETPDQDAAYDTLNSLYYQATVGRSTRCKNILKKIFGDSWDTIKDHMEAEGSTYYVWYMDGVTNLINMYLN